MLLIALGLAILGACTVLYANLRWQRDTEALRNRLEAARLPISPEVFDACELNGLPLPVQKYFLAALQDGQAIVSAVSLRHEGTFNASTSAERWKPFISTQRVIARRPGFVWDASVRMIPGLPVRVHDAYVVGTGILHASVLGLVSVANLRGGGDVATGELMRFLAEAAWYPSALLPSQGVRWTAVDDRSARATLEDGETGVTLLFRFGRDGLIDTVHAEARGRTVNGKAVPTPWRGRFWNYAFRDGMRIPLEGEAAWLLPEGGKPYWRGRITALRYEFA